MNDKLPDNKNPAAWLTGMMIGMIIVSCVIAWALVVLGAVK